MGSVYKTMSIVGIGGVGFQERVVMYPHLLKWKGNFFLWDIYSVCFHFLVYVTCEGMASRGNFRIIVFLSR